MSKKRVTISLPSKPSDKIVPQKRGTSSKKAQKAEDSSEDEVSEAESSTGQSSEDEEQEDEDSDDDLNDEMDLDAVSSEEDSDDSGAEGEDEEFDSDADENLPKLKKRKKNKDDGAESFATAVNAILGSKLKAYDRKDPILARSKTTLKKAESEKLEAKARRALLAEKKVIYDKDRIKDLLPKDDSTARAVLDHEKKLKKIAQRGVVQLFNVVMTTQNRTAAEVSNTKVFGEEQKEKLITEISKEKFFDLVKAAGED